MSDTTPEVIDEAFQALKQAKRRLELAIDLTPTGARRNAITHANMHVMSAINDLLDMPEQTG